MLISKSLHKSYGKLQILKGIDLEIKQGEVVSIVGPSGAGKTTLLQILGTLDNPDSGEVMIGGEGFDTLEANIKLGFKGDERDYGIGAQIIRDLGISKMKLMSNNPTKRTGLIGYGLEVVENVALEIGSNEHNESYLKTKRDKMGHSLKLDK